MVLLSCFHPPIPPADANELLDVLNQPAGPFTTALFKIMGECMVGVVRSLGAAKEHQPRFRSASPPCMPNSLWSALRFPTPADVDGSGQISFSEFVHVCATYCMYSQDDILDCEWRAAMLPPTPTPHPFSPSKRNTSKHGEHFPPACACVCECAVCFGIFDTDMSGWLDEVRSQRGLCGTCA
jgi:hypothetical protein